MNNKILAIVLFSIISLGCSKDYKIGNGDMIVGYWQALQETTVLINGVKQDDKSTNGYYIEFFDNNCGQLYDRDENPTSEFKWALQKREFSDRLLISTEVISADGSGSGLFQTQLSSLHRIEEMNMQLFRDNEAVIDGDNYSYNHWTYLVRQR